MPEENKEKQGTSLQANLSGEVSDVLGFGKGIEKLIDVLSRGVGAISRPFLIKRDADAKAYELRKLAEAMGENQKLLGSVQYESGGLTMSAQGQIQSLPPTATLEERAQTRVAYQDAKRQLNTESVVQHAAEQLHDKESISDEKVDEDWIGRFFDIAGYINSEQMQELWGRILAGEITKPGSYSLRTLDTLRNIKKDEAAVFVKVAQATFKIGGVWAVLHYNDFNDFYGKEFGFNYDDICSLDDAGLMSVNLTSRSFTASQERRQNPIVYGNKVLIIEAIIVPATYKFQHYSFTAAGIELLPLVERIAKHALIKKFASTINKKLFSVKYADLLDMKDDVIAYDGLTAIVV
jgi:uncharacterized repeat protein (TIGR03899 family)